MKKLTSKQFYAYYLVVLYFVTFAAILLLTSSCKTPRYANNRVDKCPTWSAVNHRNVRN